MDKLKEYYKTYFHQCPLCHTEVKSDSEFGLVITKEYFFTKNVLINY